MARGFWPAPLVLEWMEVVNGRTKMGRIFARSNVQGSNFQEAGARRWILERRHGLARGIYNRPAVDGRFSGK